MNDPLKNKITIECKITGDFLLIGTYISKNECSIKVLRFDEENGWKSFNILIDDIEILNIPESNISNFTYNFKTETELFYVNAKTQQNIPKTIIQTHETDIYKNIYHKNAVESLKELNPEYEYVFFNSIERRQFIKNNFEKEVLDAYDTLVSGAYQADLFRYCYLYINGGCYFDYKTIARVALRDIIKNEDIFLICIDYDKQNHIDRENGVGGYLNSVIMCHSKNSNLLKLINACVDNILNKQMYFYHSIITKGYTDILLLTGPTLMYNIFKEETVYENLRFKHIIENNDESYYKNFQIVDIDSKKILFTKTYKTCKEVNHYSELWARRELFFKNKCNILNLTIFVYPHPFPDTFRFLINKDNIYTERSDTHEQWGLNLQIKVINNITSETENITIGRNRCTKLQNIKPVLPNNVYLSNDIKESNLVINENNNVIIITDEFTEYINYIKSNTLNSIVILTTTNSNYDIIHKYSILADYVILYITPDCYYYCFEKNLKYIYMSLHITELLKNKIFNSFKHFKHNISTSMISRKNINKYINNCRRFLKTYTQDDKEFTEFNENLCIVDIPLLYNLQITNYNHVLSNLNNIIKQSGEKLEGNIFYEHDSFGEYTICSDFESKRYNLFYYGRHAYNILEIGFNGGHSTFLYLIANPHSKIQLFDLGEHSYSRMCFNYLNETFPDRLSIIWGDSTKTVESFRTHIKYDFIHIDGGHTRYIAETDFYNCKELADEDSLIMIDDTQSEPLLSLFDDIVNYGDVSKEKLEYDTDNHMLLKIKH
jgi:mannosyltransferase OCH1-like enzyme